MTKSPVIPSKLPELLNNYKKKNHLNNYEMVNEINNLINNNSDKILMKTDDYGETQPSSALCLTHRTKYVLVLKIFNRE